MMGWDHSWDTVPQSLIMFSTEGLPGVGVGGWWAPGLLNGQHQDSSAINEGEKEKKKKAGEKEKKRREKKTAGEEEGTKMKSKADKSSLSSSLDSYDPEIN